MYNILLSIIYHTYNILPTIPQYTMKAFCLLAKTLQHCHDEETPLKMSRIAFSTQLFRMII